MSRVQVVSDDGKTVVDILREDIEDAWVFGRCRTCGEAVTDRGHFEDTVQAAEIHVDHRH